jgi:hypothetical protein
MSTFQTVSRGASTSTMQTDCFSLLVLGSVSMRTSGPDLSISPISSARAAWEHKPTQSHATLAQQTRRGEGTFRTATTTATATTARFWGRDMPGPSRDLAPEKREQLRSAVVVERLAHA